MSRSSDVNVDSLAEALQSAKVSSSGVSFAGKSLKLDTEEDAKPVIEAINNCPQLEYLNLEGNTLGVDAAKAIAQSLEKHGEFKRALWKDLFTGRMKTEIPKALEFLGAGLVTAGARLTELDLSDNAFGPIGVEGLAALLRSSTCYALQELRLNNNGLGITGGKILASALTDCYNSSKQEGKPLALKVFIAGRNRLENDGAKALSEVFKLIGTLEEVAMPQNGIYHRGITALSEAFRHNTNLQILNLNDNTIGSKGAFSLAKALPTLQKLKEINFGDCLLKTKGALLLANGLDPGHENLEELILGFNEIRTEGGVNLVNAMTNKIKLKSLILDGNQFGTEGAQSIKNKLKEIGKFNTLGSLDDNESEGESDEDENQSDSDHESDNETDDDFLNASKKEPEAEESATNISIEEFMKDPTGKNLILLGSNREELILKTAQPEGVMNAGAYITAIMKVSSLSNNADPEVANISTTIAEKMYEELFVWGKTQKDALVIIQNNILVHLGLIKSEDKKFKPKWKLDGCLNVLKNVCQKNFVPDNAKLMVKCFIERDINNNGEYLQIKKDILSILA
ncbi:unnamed protein product [Ceutorhynchus assimilis]|uniref:Ran-GTPase activating protein 1 C-terminal domain-containing protein n=1 Tax=Ceutorhynchus assimilis TaxID=467358 RepID=A0A9P0DHC6_9CUCU|nr:unnamed protein product [Ceutorhynchus assimilis]